MVQYKYIGVCFMEFTIIKIAKNLVLILSSLLDSSKTSGSAGGNKTNLSSGGTFTSTCRWHTNMLMVTTTVRMLYGILSHTSDLRPAVTLDGVLVESTSSLQQRLIGTSTSGNNTDLGTNTRRDSLLTSGRKSKLCGSLVFVVGDDDGVGTGASRKCTTVTTLGFNVAHNGSLRDRSQRQDVTASKSGLLSAVNELSTVHTFGTEEQLIVALVSVSVGELNTAHGGTSTRVVHNFLNDTTDVSLLFGKVKRSELDGTLSGTGVRLIDGGLTLSLDLDVLSHLV